MQNTWHNILRLHSDQTQVFLFILMTAVRFGGAGIRGFLERKCHQMWHCGSQSHKLVIRPAAWMNETTVTHIMCRVSSLTFTHLWMLTITVGPTCLTYCSRCMTSDQRQSTPGQQPGILLTLDNCFRGNTTVTCLCSVTPVNTSYF